MIYWLHCLGTHGKEVHHGGSTLWSKTAHLMAKKELPKDQEKPRSHNPLQRHLSVTYRIHCRPHLLKALLSQGNSSLYDDFIVPIGITLLICNGSVFNP